ncbi:nickel pincer cofactor biosynthesis protein LarC [Halarsenatibacter silvermanii]|uniref:Pyridinium-3,5-bisthiocarboxylic acid mononucleotide nickel insertion protein n=1 Tax=Halarsenatibacter silvermanii TaxID=321763 RepID=A0A1G9PT95_9FIRM|nr:nickel pincer cofactor biosynthesis protein LarC [Halarsenatibacter silvermanii]SDM02014.1 hypothetical protein SAMN04488692_11426 [Halarsenatibacter silvermanii]
MDAYFNCFSGISGNMVLGALLDLGLDRESWEQELDKLGISEEYLLEIEKVKRSGISAQYVRVDLLNTGCESSAGKQKKSEVRVRHLEDIEELINNSEFSSKIKEDIINIFSRLARAEGRVHDLPPDKVHFHEVGAVDAIVDIAGAVIGLDMLGIERIVASPLHTGTGFVDCAHGSLPVPAPATLELLKGVPVFSRGIDAEMVTPTGAAVITTLADRFDEMPELKVKSTGYGAGTKNLEIPNLLRVTTGDFVEESDYKDGPDKTQIQQVTRISTNIDDMNPEFYQHVMKTILSAGALDVYLIPVQMKKNRPGHILNVLCADEDVEKISKLILEETSSLGVRVESSIERRCLKREIIRVETKWGTVKLKIALDNGELLNVAPEYEDCRALAEKHGIPLKRIYRDALCQFDKEQS